MWWNNKDEAREESEEFLTISVTQQLYSLVSSHQKHLHVCDTIYKSPQMVTGLPWWFRGNDSTCQCRRHGSGRSPGEEMTTHPGIFTWEISRTEEPGELQCMGSQRVGSDLVTEQQQQQMVTTQSQWIKCRAIMFNTIRQIENNIRLNQLLCQQRSV